MPWLLTGHVSSCLEDIRQAHGRMRFPYSCFFDASIYFRSVVSSGQLPKLRTQQIECPDPEPNAVNPDENNTRSPRNSSAAGIPPQEQSQHPASSLLEAHGSFPLQNATFAISGGVLHAESCTSRLHSTALGKQETAPSQNQHVSNPNTSTADPLKKITSNQRMKGGQSGCAEQLTIHLDLRLLL